MLARVCSVLFFSATLFAQDPRGPVVAILNGTNIYEAELRIEGQLLQIQRQEFEIRRRAVRDLISTRIVELTAKAKGLSVAQFLAMEDVKIESPADASLRGFYLADLARYKQQPFESVRDEVLRDFAEAQRQAHRSELVSRLMTAADVEMLIRPPRTEVESASAPRRGPASAPVTIVEFSDFQCPYCKNVEATLKAVAAKYGDRVSIVFKDFPLTEAHSHAQTAAEASHCAADQGRFWPYHDLLFAAAPAFSTDVFVQLAAKVGADEKVFEQCLQSGKHTASVAANAEQGKAVGVDATPTFFINGVALAGAASIQEFEALIDMELAVNGRK